MKKRLFVAFAVASMMLVVTGASADPPVYEAGVISPEVGRVVPGGECSAESAFDAAYPGDLADDAKASQLKKRQIDAAHTGAAYEACQRLKIVFGPIWSKPGQNDVLIQPVTFEKPLYDGYLVRFKPDLVTVEGDAPRVKDLHLHHGTWLNPGFFGGGAEDQYEPLPNPGRTYGWGPWIASGEEKTVAIWPEGFGLKILASDSWLFLHMIHNATAETFPVYVTYDIDYIPADVAEADEDGDGAPNLRNTKGIWLDVGDCSWHDECVKDEFNPIFNIQRGHGSVEKGACIFPRENCAAINTLAETSAQQGEPVGRQFDEWTIPIDGTLVMMGGHMHNGGLRDDVYLIRDGKKRLIHRSDAYYFDHDWDPESWSPADDFKPNKSKVGGPPTSWDFVMTGVIADLGWKVNVKEGDKLRLEGVYDSTIASWYEQMGIVMSWIVPGEHLGVDPFDPKVTIHEGVNQKAVQPGTVKGYDLPGAEHGGCTPGARTLCVRGQMTHARIPTSGDHWTCEKNGCPKLALDAPDGQVMSDIPFGGFGYGPADLGVIGATGIPLVPLGESVTFWNADTAAYMWHTLTRCAAPCSGTTSANYPLADGQYDDLIDPKTGRDPDGRTVRQMLRQDGPDPMDFDSGQIGYGTGANNKVSWEFTPTRTGTFNFFCRIHPGMRGAIRVVENA